eukprot:jgi/Psemu1/25486/gm1.25486_g
MADIVEKLSGIELGRQENLLRTIDLALKDKSSLDKVQCQHPLTVLFGCDGEELDQLHHSLQDELQAETITIDESDDGAIEETQNTIDEEFQMIIERKLIFFSPEQLNTFHDGQTN